MENEAYGENQDLGVYITSEKGELYQIMNVDHWPRCIIDEIEWFEFQGILEHTAFHAKGYDTLLHKLLKVFHMFSIIF